MLADHQHPTNVSQSKSIMRINKQSSHPCPFRLMMFLPKRQTHFDLGRRRGVTPTTVSSARLSIKRLFNVTVVIQKDDASSLLDHCHSRYECSTKAGKIPQCK